MVLLAATLLAAAPMPNATPAQVKDALKALHGPTQAARIERGVDQVAALWTKADGDLLAFAKEHFLTDPKALEQTFARFEGNFEQLDGHLLEIGRELRRATELELGQPEKVDALFAEFDPAAHLVDDLFRSKLAFVALLNFPATTLEQRVAEGKAWSRDQWAQARLTGRFSRRIPADVQQGITEAQSRASMYIDSYNVWMHHVLSEKGERLFPKGKRLVSHWNLRDELKANYADKDGLEKQRTIIKIMERIVTQAIPAAIIDNPRLDWNPFTNAVTPAPAAELEENAPARSPQASNAAEPNTRYERFLDNFKANFAADRYSPTAKTAVDRAFALSAELPEARVKALLESVLKSPLVGKVAAEIQRSLGRPLEPADLWFAGFSPKGALPEAELDAKLKAKYPSPEAFAKDIPRILKDLGFAPARAQLIADRIRVDPARGAGHAMQAARRGDFARLRTRVEPGGMNYKGYNIAVHELGHNVEQTISLYDVDHTLLAGVPNTAFTEAIAFVFQAKDIELLGLGKPSAEQERKRVLNDFWQTWEIAGVALVDVEVWRWLYEHPKATPAQLKDATVKIAQRVWNDFYAPHLGAKDSPLLGIYSHMISYPLYLFNYPLGHLIAFQIEGQVKKTGAIGPELERMARLGAIGPDVWMEQATGLPVSSEPLLQATEAALGK